MKKFTAILIAGLIAAPLSIQAKKHQDSVLTKKDLQKINGARFSDGAWNGFDKFLTLIMIGSAASGVTAYKVGAGNFSYPSLKKNALQNITSAGHFTIIQKPLETLNNKFESKKINFSQEHQLRTIYGSVGVFGAAALAKIAVKLKRMKINDFYVGFNPLKLIPSFVGFVVADAFK